MIIYTVGMRVLVPAWWIDGEPVRECEIIDDLLNRQESPMIMVRPVNCFGAHIRWVEKAKLVIKTNDPPTSGEGGEK